MTSGATADGYLPRARLYANWKPAELLRCNFIVRGVFLDQAGEHRVEFKYQPPLTGLYLSLASVIAALGLLGYLAIGRKSGTKTSGELTNQGLNHNHG